MKFYTDLKKISTFSKSQVSKLQVSKLPQLYRYDMNSAKLNFKELTPFLDKIPEHKEFTHSSIDTRTHMLMKNMFPCIPGWHCDDFDRDEETGQPNLLTVKPIVHYMFIIGECSSTEFLSGNVILTHPQKITTNLYAHYDIQINDFIDKKLISPVSIKSNTLYKFGPLCMHRGTPAKFNGWRFFFRVSFSNHREPKMKSDIKHKCM